MKSEKKKIQNLEQSNYFKEKRTIFNNILINLSFELNKLSKQVWWQSFFNYRTVLA